MYYAIEVTRWCIALHREAAMRLTYRREYISERKIWCDLLISTELLEG